MAVNERPALVLRFADVGVATYASLRVVGQPDRTVTWVVDEALVVAALAELAGALPEPMAGESVGDALARALTAGAFATLAAEAALAERLGTILLSEPAWKLLLQCASAPRVALFVSPSTRLARIPWGSLALPVAHEPEGCRLVEIVDVLMAIQPNIANAARRQVDWSSLAGQPALLILDPRVPGQRADSTLGSVLGRPSPDTRLASHFEGAVTRHAVLPKVTKSIELFRRTDADRDWLAALLAQAPARLLYVGHAIAADDRSRRADLAALHLAEPHPLTAADVIARQLSMPPRVALLACASGGDYRFDEATGLVAAMILCGAQLVTATLWSLPTTAGYRQFVGGDADPMADLVIAVDRAHDAADGGCAVNGWQRDLMRRWRSGDTTVSPLYWAALATFAVDGAR